MSKIRLCVIGNGMVGHRLIEELTDKTSADHYEITIFCEEPRIAYDRVHLSSYFAHHTAEDLSLVREGFYQKHQVRVLIGEKALNIDRQRKEVSAGPGRVIAYDKLVIATGSRPWIPPINGSDTADCFVYRTISDLNAIEACALRSRRGAVIGGGLLGLEAAGALKNLGTETHVVEFADVLMAEQLDRQGGEQLRKKIERLGVQVHTGKNTLQIIQQGSESRKTLIFADGSQLEVDFVVFSTGIRPQDELARQCGLAIAERGGIVINDQCQTSDPDIYAIGECASWHQHVYGLVAPGYKMARVVAGQLSGQPGVFDGADMSAKLKLLGVDVGGIGDAHGRTPGSQSFVYLDETKEVYKRLVISQDAKQLLGAVLVGDTSDYSDLLQLMLNRIELPANPGQLILPASAGTSAPLPGVDALPDTAQICSCFDVSKGDLITAIHQGCHTVAALKAATNAGTGCGGCLPLLSRVLNSELARQGIEVNHHLCEHFPYSRQQLFHLARVGQIKTFEDLLKKYGKGYGCEICKPAVAGILASAWNDYVLQPRLIPLQDSNDNFLANIQKDGTYSVIPRTAGGEITPGQLRVLGDIASEYSLYSKITGSQRIALFGVQKDDLPAIWGALIAAGFETGHAYAKALRMAKTCVGSRWCRYGVGDSTSLGVMLENRYKGIRTPHKMKFGVSGCTRECAEAQSKDIGIIASEKGWNLYVCGNGGMKPRHADLLAADLDQQTLVRYIDRFMMFYLSTADKLQRTSVWLETLQGGIDYLKQVIIDDKLNIAQQSEQDLQRLREQYRCEWLETVQQPESQLRFRHFINSAQRDNLVQTVPEGQQHRPATVAERIPLIFQEEQS